MQTAATLTNDELAARLSCAGEVLQELSWHALDGTWPRIWDRECTTPPAERVTAALADIPSSRSDARGARRSVALRVAASFTREAALIVSAGVDRASGYDAP
jgi:hypothetical protein